ncbi:hypothetical protein Lalb_Chr03g0038611 [Lupinus albus]|uniref:Uncharacterized protein n=1 Tax=Lupinus albus TaxID=3870 RepID=A0A6A4QXS0_LUPAL|nr:hypothetical protein Lalb_Chr03g0038611 [Lupinus albus]
MATISFPFPAVVTQARWRAARRVNSSPAVASLSQRRPEGYEGGSSLLYLFSFPLVSNTLGRFCFVLYDMC